MKRYLLIFLMMVMPCFGAATYYYQAGGDGNINDVSEAWNAAANGSGAWLEAILAGGVWPADGDLNTSTGDTITLDANGQGITVNVDVTCTKLQTGLTGGTFTVSATGIDIVADVYSNATTCLTLANGSSGTLTTVSGGVDISGAVNDKYGIKIDTTSTTWTINATQGGIVGQASSGTGGYGVYITSTGTVNITGDILGGAGTNSSHGLYTVGACTLSITGDIDGSATANRGRGVQINGAGATVTVTGTVTGGNTACTGFYNVDVSTVSITAVVAGVAAGYAQATGTATIGTVTGGSTASTSAASNSGTGTINITTSCTGGSASAAYGLSNTGAGTINVKNVVGGSNALSAGIYNALATGTVNITGTLYFTASTSVPLAGLGNYRLSPSAKINVYNSVGTLRDIVTGGSGGRWQRF